MVAAKTLEARSVEGARNIVECVNIAREGGVVSFSDDGVVLMSRKAYQELEKAARNAEYLAMLDRSRAQLDAGIVVVKSLAELEAMAKG